MTYQCGQCLDYVALASLTRRPVAPGRTLHVCQPCAEALDAKRGLSDLADVYSRIGYETTSASPERRRLVDEYNALVEEWNHEGYGLEGCADLARAMRVGRRLVEIKGALAALDEQTRKESGR
jgi:hypothetical protein